MGNALEQHITRLIRRHPSTGRWTICRLIRQVTLSQFRSVTRRSGTDPGAFLTGRAFTRHRGGSHPPTPPHHRANGSVHSGSRGYATKSRTVEVAGANGSMHSKLRLIELWTGPGTRGRDHSRPYWRPIADLPQLQQRSLATAWVFHCRQRIRKRVSWAPSHPHPVHSSAH